MRIGVDVGGTKIEGLALGADGVELVRRRIATPRGDYDATLNAIADLILDLERESGASGSVGIGIPGAVSSRTGLVKNANSTWLIGRPLQADLERRLARPIRIANDANCFALSEATDGAAAGARVVFGVIAGTGTGGGIVIDGRVLEGRNAIAGEWGHNPLPWATENEHPGPQCYCGRRGCIETFLSGPGLARDHATATGQAWTAEEVVTAAGEGDPAAAASLERYALRMARAFAGIINILDPDVIVLGGGMSNVEALYARVPELWTPFVFSDTSSTPLVKARHGDSSGVRGAAWLWPSEAEAQGTALTP
jgi:fructokinase